jgi:hypothetical protein
LESFQITSYEIQCDVSTRTEFFLIYIDEQNKFPSNLPILEYESKGFDLGKTIQDFPIRGKAVYLVIRTRLWRHKENGTIVKNDYNYISKGSKLTQEMSDFLKYTSQYEA